MNNRYEENPLNILLENLVLHSIGYLDKKKYKELSSIEAKLQQIYGRDGDWISILKSELKLPIDFEKQVHTIWQRNLQIAKKRGEELSPITFAQMFVDTNFGN